MSRKTIAALAVAISLASGAPLLAQITAPDAKAFV